MLSLCVKLLYVRDAMWQSCACVWVCVKVLYVKLLYVKFLFVKLLYVCERCYVTKLCECVCVCVKVLYVKLLYVKPPSTISATPATQNLLYVKFVCEVIVCERCYVTKLCVCVCESIVCVCEIIVC